MRLPGRAALLGLASVPWTLAGTASAAELLPPIVVTPTRVPEDISGTLAPVSVVTREDIERVQAPDMLELLRLQAGVDLARTGGPGSQTSLFLRGTNSNQVLVLIDGVRASSASNGLFAFEQMSPNQIERIEVVRGPRASLYGSDAIGGVVQIFTRDNSGPNARVGGGSYHTGFADAGWGGAVGEKGRASIQASYEDTRGFSATNPAAGPFVYDPDDDGYDNFSLSAMGGIALGETADLELRGWRSKGSNEFDQGDTDTLNQVLSARLRATLREGWDQTLLVAQSRDDSETESAFASRFESERLSADWQHDFQLPNAASVTVGIDYWRDDVVNKDLVLSETVYDERITNRGLYANGQYPIGAFELQASVRHDDHSSFGGKTTGLVAFGYTVNSALRLVGSVGTAFRAPNANELFSPGVSFGPGLPPQFAGNPNLDPESSTGIDVGLRHQVSPNETLGIDFYATNVEDLIAFEGQNFQAININEAHLRGLEFSYAGNHGPWLSSVAVTLQRARNAETDEDLLRRPRHKAALQLDYRFESGAILGSELIAVSEREDVNTTLGGYGLVNLRGRLPIHRDVSLEVRVENLFDKDYELAEGFNTPGLSAYLALRWEPRS